MIREEYPILWHYAQLSPCTLPCLHDHCAKWREARRALAEIEALRQAVADDVAALHDEIDQLRGQRPIQIHMDPPADRVVYVPVVDPRFRR